MLLDGTLDQLDLGRQAGLVPGGEVDQNVGIPAAAAAGLVDEYKMMCESALSIYRAGADMLITYSAKELADAMKRGDIG